MKRRNVLVGMGGLAMGSGALVGSGAFTSVEAERDLAVAVVDDPNALLGLGMCEDDEGEPYPNGDYVNLEDGMLSIDISDNDNVPGDGVNPNAITVINNVFQICNNGTQEVCVSLEFNSLVNPNQEEDIVKIYREDEEERVRVRSGDGFLLDVGHCRCFSLEIDTRGIDMSDEEIVAGNLMQPVTDRGYELVINANADIEETPCAEPVEDPVPEFEDQGFYIEVFDDTSSADGEPGDLHDDYGTIKTSVEEEGTELEIDLELTGGAEDAYLEKAYGVEDIDFTDVDSIEIDITEFDRDDEEGVAYFAAVSADDLEGLPNKVGGAPISAVNRENLREDGQLGHLDGDEDTGQLSEDLDDDMNGSAVKLSRSDGVIAVGGASTENIEFDGDYSFEGDDNTGTVILDVSDLDEDAFICVGAGQLSTGDASSSLLRVTQARFEDDEAVFSFENKVLSGPYNPYRG